MAAVQRYVVFACIGLAVVNFAALSNDGIREWLFQNMQSVKSRLGYSIGNDTFKTSNTTTPKTSTPVWHNVTNYDHNSNRSQPKNVSLCISHKFPHQGRLGNQMFKYASSLAIARAQGRRLLYDPKTSVAETFKLAHVGVNASSNTWPEIKEGSFFDKGLMNLPLRDVQISGYLLSHFYFTAIVHEVKQEFTFRDSIASAAANILHDVYVKYNSSMVVGVHVRRGDFLHTSSKKFGYGTPDKSYFVKAFKLMKSKFPGRNITFLVASDDLKWCSENLSGNDVTMMPPASPAVHLAVLSMCEHVIMSGGTYGWWGAWLANGIVIYYPDYAVKGTVHGRILKHDLFFPSWWIPLTN